MPPPSKPFPGDSPPDHMEFHPCRSTKRPFDASTTEPKCEFPRLIFHGICMGRFEGYLSPLKLFLETERHQKRRNEFFNFSKRLEGFCFGKATGKTQKGVFRSTRLLEPAWLQLHLTALLYRAKVLFTELQLGDKPALYLLTPIKEAVLPCLKVGFCAEVPMPKCSTLPFRLLSRTSLRTQAHLCLVFSPCADFGSKFPC